MDSRSGGSQSCLFDTDPNPFFWQEILNCPVFCNLAEQKGVLDESAWHCTPMHFVCPCADVVCCFLQRILQVEYEFPPHVKVSKECRDLLHKILVPDPAKRITVPEIQNHVWYKKDLPPGVSDMNDNLPPPGVGLQVSFLQSPHHAHTLIHAGACSATYKVLVWILVTS